MTSLYGSHTSMICDPVEEDTILGVDRILKGEVLLKDEKGNYVTERKRLDDGLADPNRHNKPR